MIELRDPEVRVKQRDESAIRKELATVQQSHPEKLLTAEDVVNAARSEKSAMHSSFTWDDSEAAQKCRLMEARTLIRHIYVTMPDDKAESAIPKYVSLRPDRKRPGGGYREISKVLSNKQLLDELEATAKRDIEALLQRYKMLSKFVERVRAAAGIDTKTTKTKKAR